MKEEGVTGGGGRGGSSPLRDGDRSDGGGVDDGDRARLLGGVPLGLLRELLQLLLRWS